MRPGMSGDPNLISIVCPMKNEAENVALMVEDIARDCAVMGDFELILVDDGSTDDTAAKIVELQATYPWLRLIQHAGSGGQSAAIHSGVHAARGAICATLDGDGQNPPNQIPILVAAFRVESVSDRLGLVAGQRVGRQDTASKKWASKAANRIRQFVLKDKTRDTGCGLKAFRRDAFLGLPFFNHMHRYLPALFARDGWEIAHRDVTHRERAAGSSNYSNFQRAIVGVTDLIGVAWLIRRRKRVAPLERPRSETPHD